MDGLVPSSFDWVTARAQCTAAEAFESLRQLAQTNVEQINKFRGGTSLAGPRFAFKDFEDPSHRAFTVFDTFGIERRAVDFSLVGESIYIRPIDREVIHPSPILTEGGECRYKVGAEELYAWQLLRRALERLFFADELA
jgi:hypothetical protein